MQEPHSFLIVALRRIGDVLLTTPLIHSVRQRYPDAHIALLVFKGTGAILEGNTDISRVIEVPEKMKWPEIKAFWREHGRQFDWAISTQSGDRPTLLAILAGRKRAAFIPPEAGKAWWRKWLIQRPVVWDETPRHVVERYLTLAQQVGASPVARLVPPRRLDFALAERLPERDTSKPLAICHPMPMYAYKRWPDLQWRLLIQKLLEAGYQVAVTGGPGDSEKQALQTLLGPLSGQVLNLAGRFRLAELSEVLRQASLFFGTDTSVTHLAAANGIPVTAIFGPTDPRIWGPWPTSAADGVSPWKARGPHQVSGNITIIQDALPCVPCQQEGCDRHLNSRSECLQNITYDSVFPRS